jgi:serine/threonine protein kinase
LDYILVMEYVNNGNLRGCLTEITNKWYQILFLLYKIIDGLNSMHKENLIHCDFHDGNILCNKYSDSAYEILISDYLGSYQIANSFLEKNNIYGVMPFIAPEVLKGKPYAPASDIYSFSMIMWEFTSKIPPFNDRAHDIQLAYSICKGERPEIINNTPHCYINLMKKCWDKDPLKRPSASEILNIIKNWIYLPSDMKIKNISQELKNNIMEFINAPILNNDLITESHSQAYYTSRLLDFTCKELSEILEESFFAKFFELKENHKMITETYENSQIEFRAKQKELKEKNLAYQKMEQNYHDLKLDLAMQIKEFAEKENNLQDQIICLQNKKHALDNNLTEQLKQNKLNYQQIQIQINQLEQEMLNLQEKLTQTKSNIQELKFQQTNLIEQKMQLESQELTNEEKAAKLEEEITQLEKKLINEEQIKVQFTQALQIKEDKINKLQKELINLNEQLTNKEKELDEIKQEIEKTSASYNKNRKKQILNQVNKFIKAKDDFLTLREEIIKKLQIQYEVINNKISVNIFEEVVSEMKKFQNILIEYNEVGLSQMNKDYGSLMKIIQENKELEDSHKIHNILKLDSFDFNKYKIFTIATNGTRTHLDPGMMADDLKLLIKNLDELKSELGLQKKELNLVAD